LEVIRLHSGTDEDEAVYRWLQSQEKNRGKLIVMDLREVDSSDKSEKGSA
jgi:hypothetical protein